MSFSTGWQKALSQQVTDPKELFELLELDPALIKDVLPSSQTFPLKVTHSFLARMEKGNINDPLLRQILPTEKELMTTPGYTKDPLGELKANPLPGLLHKYHGRVLVTLTSACAVNCRFCFRRHYPYEDNNPGRQGWEKIFSYLSQDETIQEVILSGGDPLSLSDGLLAQFCQQLANISHIKYLRIHTRLLVALPERITKEFVDWIAQLPFMVTIIIHMNHPNEMNDDVRNVLRDLKKANVVLLNQSVLLKDVNDDVAILTKLSETLFDANVLPYYLHVLDKVQGVAHFDLPIDRAMQIHQDLANRLPGYLVPSLVREDAGAPAKTILS